MRLTTLPFVLLAALAATGCTRTATAADGRPGATPAPAAAQAVRQRTVLMTRSMQVFSDLEASLAQALQKQDKAGIDRLLSGDFEFRSPASASETARGDWLAAGPEAEIGDIEQISVHEFPGVAVASFVLSSGANAAGVDTRSYVVDVWSSTNGQWQLMTRYRSALPDADPVQEDSAPTGKG